MGRMPAINVRFENTAKQAEAERRAREERHEKEKRLEELQSQHDEDTTQMRSLNERLHREKNGLAHARRTIVEELVRSKNALGELPSTQMEAQHGRLDQYTSDQLMAEWQQIQRSFVGLGRQTFDARTGLNQEQERALNAHQAIGVLSDLFDVNISRAHGMTTDIAQKLAALLSDCLGSSLSVAVMPTKESANAIERIIRVWPLQTMDMARPAGEPQITQERFAHLCAIDALKQSGKCMVWPAWKLLDLHEKHQQRLGHNLFRSLKWQILSNVGATNLLVVANQEAALEYKRLFVELKSRKQILEHFRCPNLVGFEDGFYLQSSGIYGGGGNTRKATSLESLGPNRPHFGFSDATLRATITGHVLQSLGERIQGLQAFDEKIGEYGARIAGHESKKGIRREQAAQLGGTLREELARAAPVQARRVEGSSYSLRHQRTAEDAGLQGRNDAAKRTRT